MCSTMWLCDPGYTYKLQNYAILIDQRLSVQQQITFLYGKQTTQTTIHKKSSYRLILLT